MKTTMRYAEIAYVNKPVSRVVFGTDRPGMMANKDEFALLDAAYAAGITAFDTAACYGESEASLGRWLRARNLRDKVVVLTKAANPNDYRQRLNDYDILYDLENSLARLQTDYIDIFLLHRDDPSKPVGPVVELLNRLHREGRIGAFGGSNWTFARTNEANAYARAHGLIPFSVCSPSFGLAECLGDPWGGSVTLAGPENARWRERLAQTRMPVFAYSSLGRGFFSGRLKSADAGRARQIIGFGADEYGFPINFEKLRRAETLAAEKGVTVSQIAYAWIMGQEMNVFGITKPGSAQHIRETIESLSLSLTPQEMDWLNAREADA